MHLNVSPNAALFPQPKPWQLQSSQIYWSEWIQAYFFPSSCFFFPSQDRREDWAVWREGVVCSVIVPYSAHWKTNRSLLLINLCVWWFVIVGVPHLWTFSNTQDVALMFCVWLLSWVFSLPAHHILILLWCVCVCDVWLVCIFGFPKGL